MIHDGYAWGYVLSGSMWDTNPCKQAAPTTDGYTVMVIDDSLRTMINGWLLVVNLWFMVVI